MAVNYKASMTKDELLEITVTNGISVDDGMTKKQIAAAIDAHNAAEGAEAFGCESTPSDGEQPAEGAQDGPEGYDLFVYAGPTLPCGRLKANAVFRGTLKDVSAYLADVLEEYPQVAKLIVPANRLGAFSVRMKTPGNIAHKHYNDIVSAMRGEKEA